MSNSLPLDHSAAMRNSDPIALTVHPPERRSKLGIPLLCAGCGCCCCCCCCLHSMGGLAGALTVPPDLMQDALKAPRSLLPSVDIRSRYWKTLGIVSIVTTAIGLFAVGLTVLIILLPLFQLLASLIVLVTIQKLPILERSRARWQLGRLTLRGFLGAFCGTLMMIALFSIFSR